MDLVAKHKQLGKPVEFFDFSKIDKHLRVTASALHWH